MNTLRRFIIILPVYEDRESLKSLLRDIAGISIPPVNLLIVDDGSVRALPHPKDLRDAGLAGEVIRLHRNVGHQRAIAFGLAHVHRKFPGWPVLVMDADGEDRADTIPELIRRFELGDAEIVAAKRVHRTESLSFRLLYYLYTALFRLLTGRGIRFGNFALLSEFAVRRLTTMPELPTHFAANVLASRLPLALVSADRGHRYAGKSRMCFMSLVAHGMCSIMVFASAVSLRVGIFCSVAAAACLMLLLVSPVMNLSSTTTPGWLTTVTGPLIVIFLQATALGILSMIMAGLARISHRVRTNLSDDLVEQAGPMNLGGASKQSS